jgi:hypothetical protein
VKRPRQFDVDGVECWAGPEVADGVPKASAVAGSVGCYFYIDRFDVVGEVKGVTSPGSPLPGGDAVRPDRLPRRLLQVVGEVLDGCRGQ